MLSAARALAGLRWAHPAAWSPWHRSLATQAQSNELLRHVQQKIQVRIDMAHQNSCHLNLIQPGSACLSDADAWRPPHIGRVYAGRADQSTSRLLHAQARMCPLQRCLLVRGLQVCPPHPMHYCRDVFGRQGDFVTSRKQSGVLGPFMHTGMLSPQQPTDHGS
jgi:hypothetical protein